MTTLLDALQGAATVAGRGGRLQLGGDHVYGMGDGSEAWVDYHIPGLDLPSLVCSADLARIAADLPGTLAGVTLTRGRATVRTETASAWVGASDELFALPTTEAGEEVDIDSETLLRALEIVSPAAAPQPERYGLYGVHVHDRGDDAAIVATDGHRLHLYAVPREIATVIPPRSLLPRDSGRLLALLGGSERLTLGSAGGWLYARADGVTVWQRLVDGEFPDYTAIIPDPDTSIAFSAPTSDLRAALRRADRVEGGKSPSPTRVKAGDDVQISRSSRESGRGHEERIPGEGCIELGLSARYLLDALGPVTSTTAVVRCAHALSPMRIDDGQYMAIVMPMRLD